jgi:hypothetical protein
MSYQFGIGVALKVGVLCGISEKSYFDCPGNESRRNHTQDTQDPCKQS